MFKLIHIHMRGMHLDIYVACWDYNSLLNSKSQAAQEDALNLMHAWPHGSNVSNNLLYIPPENYTINPPY